MNKEYQCACGYQAKSYAGLMWHFEEKHPKVIKDYHKEKGKHEMFILLETRFKTYK